MIRLAPNFMLIVSAIAAGRSLATAKLMIRAGISQLTSDGRKMAKNSAKDDIDSFRADVRRNLGANGCYSQPNATVCSDLDDADARAKRNATISTVGFIGAGVGVAGLVTFLLLPDQKKSSATSVYPLLDQHTMGLGASGRF